MLSIIIPVKEPEPFLEQLIREIDSALDRDWYFEILVQREEGLTNAIIQGVKKSRGNIIIAMDADGTHDPKYIPQMLEKFGEYNIVYGIKEKDDRGIYRRIITKVFAFISRVILKLKIHDLSGFVLARKDLFNMIKPSSDFKFILPLLYLNRNAKAYELKIICSNRKMGKSKANWKQALKILSLIFKLKLGTY